VLGHGDEANRTTPTLVASIDTVEYGKVVQAAGGGAHSLVLMSKPSGSNAPATTTTVLACGRGLEGQLGLGNSPSQRPNTQHTPTVVTALAPHAVSTVACAPNGNFSAALTAGGQLLTWGVNGMGELGRGRDYEAEMGKAPASAADYNVVGMGCTLVV
jgi:alpha-tubulin suppressor-like RCC1 family protein